MDARTAAIETLRKELEAQPEAVPAALEERAAEIEQVGWSLRGERAVASIGIGDSYLVGALACAVAAPSFAVQVVSSSQIVARWPSVRVHLVHSIGGTTPVTLAAARLLVAAGRQVVAVTGEAGSPLVVASHQAITLDIPRFPPDAKVPGTLTVSTPLAVMLALEDIVAGQRPFGGLGRLAETLSASVGTACASLAAQPEAWRSAPRAVHVITSAGARPVAQYLASKLVEGLAIPTMEFEAETWLHVAKHAVTEGSLVVALSGARDQQEIFLLARDETRRRGGFFLDGSLQALEAAPTTDTVGSGEVCCAFDAQPRLERAELWHLLLFSQHLLLKLLEASNNIAPFQAHRLSRNEIAGLRRRVYVAPTPQVVDGGARERLMAAIEAAPTISLPRLDGGIYPFAVYPFGERGTQLPARLTADIVEALAEALQGEDATTAIFTTEPGGVGWGTALAYATARPLIIARMQPTTAYGSLARVARTHYSTRSLHFSDIRPGARVIVLDDVISSGGTIRTVLSTLGELGVDVALVLAIHAKTEAHQQIASEFGVRVCVLSGGGRDSAG